MYKYSQYLRAGASYITQCALPRCNRSPVLTPATLTAKALKFRNNQFIFLGTRTVFNMTSLKIDSFLANGKEVRSSLVSTESFIEKMKNLLNVIESDTKHLILTEDLRCLIAICQEDITLMDLTVNIYLKYAEQVKHVRDIGITRFEFGPVIMRLLYIHDAVDNALKLLLDEEFGCHFLQATSYQLVMDLLFKKGRYDDVSTLMENIMDNEMFHLPNTCCLIGLATYYKINTDEAFETALKLFRQLTADPHKRVSLRSRSFLALFAVNKGRPELALELLSIASPAHFNVFNISCLARAAYGDFNNVINSLRGRALIDIPVSANTARRPIICFDVMDRLERLITEKGDEHLISEIQYYKKVCENMKLISDKSLEENLVIQLEETNVKPTQRVRRPRVQE